MPSPIRLLLSDVDGTLVTHDKQLTDATVAAVHRLRDAGIGFTITSSRPHFGLRATIAALDLTLPVGAFNGGVIAGSDLAVLEQHAIPEAAARQTVEFLRQAGVEIWVFTAAEWVVVDPDGPFLPKESRTIATQPKVMSNFDSVIGSAIKIVGASNAHDRLAAGEGELRGIIRGEAEVARSQSYYLDITPPGVDKGSVLRALSKRLDIPTESIAAIGDMDNDVAMLRLAGLPIAMGNGSEAAKAAASVVTRSNEEDGLAYAVDHFILGGER